MSDADLVRRGDVLFAPGRVGRPGRGAVYWPLWALAQSIRLAWRIEVRGADHLASGPAILVGNHLRAIDPVLLGVAVRRRLTFIAKAEALRGIAGSVLRRTGQIPLRRGDEATTEWALAACADVLRQRQIVVVYPEATRSPDGHSLHRLHRRLLVPLVRDNKAVAIHAVSVGYPPPRFGRRRVDLRISAPLAVAQADAGDVVDLVRDALLRIGGMPYVDQFGRSIKARRTAETSPPAAQSTE